MVIRSEKNLYPGVNPHLNSALQQRGGGWKSFHAAHIIHIADALEDLLPPDYAIRPEESIQISYYDADINPPSKVTRTSVADALILKSFGVVQSATAILEPDIPTLTVGLAIVTEDEDSLTGLVIYLDETPITRIEFLSPSNKPGGSHYSDYMENRSDTLLGGLRLVEIDYLHEHHPISDEIPSYKAGYPQAYPYHILISDPRPTVSDGRTKVYSRGIFDPLPILHIPLEGNDTVRFDFGAVYNQTYGKRTFYRQVDYSQLPVNFEAYSAADQEIIRAYMARIASEQ